MNIKTWVLAAILICGTSVFTACSSDNIDIPATAQEYTGVPQVILDTDIGSSTDDLFALTERGTVVLNDDGTVIFTPSAKGNSRFQMPGDDAWRSAMLEIIRNVNKIH